MSSRFIRGLYTSGANHSGYRPLFYKYLGLWQGTINIRVSSETDENILLPTKRIPGLDPIDENQDFLVRACVLKGVAGYQVLPINKHTGRPKGHHWLGVIEIGLVQHIDVKFGDELEVELGEFVVLPAKTGHLS
jgi:CTP-dependent riboflavin kinase